MVSLRWIELLNGRDPDPIKARSGKLGYAGYFNVRNVWRFIKLMGVIKTRRNGSNQN